MRINAIQAHYSTLKKEPNETQGIRTLQKADSPIQKKQMVYATNLPIINFGAKSGEKSNFEKEIEEQPQVLKNLAKKYFSYTGKINMDLDISSRKMKNAKSITIVASGSSKYAGEAAQNLMEKAADVPVKVVSAGEFMYNDPKIGSNDIVIFVSQSGNTADTLRALDVAKSKKAKTFAITNNEDSEIAKKADSHVNMDAGVENAVSASKTVTASMYTLMTMGLRLGEIKGSLRGVKLNDYIKDFQRLPYLIDLLVTDNDEVKRASRRIANSENVYYYAKGGNIGAAREGALKLTETTGKRVIAESSSEALHGSFASIQPEDSVVQVISGNKGEEIYKTSISNINEIIKKRGVTKPIVIQKANDWDVDEKVKGRNVAHIEVPNCGDDVYPILTTVVFQQIANEVSKKMGTNPDNGMGFLTKYRGDIEM